MSQQSMDKKATRSTPQFTRAWRSAFTVATVMAWAVAASAWAESASQANELTGLSIKATGAGTEVSVQCATEPVFNVFRLKEPDRLVVDVSNGNVTAIKGHHDSTGAVTGVMATQFADGQAQVGRLLLALGEVERYDVKANGRTLLISVEAKQGAAPAVSAAPKASTPGETIVSSRTDEKAVAHPATRLKALVRTSDGLRLKTDGEVARFDVIELADPSRLALDLFGVKGSPRAPALDHASVREVRVGSHGDKARVVVEFSARTGFDVRRRADGLEVRLAAPERNDLQAEASIEIDGQAIAVDERADVRDGAALRDEASQSKARVLDVKFEESAGAGVVRLKLEGKAKWSVERPDGKSAVLTLEGAKIARQLEKSLDTSDLDTAIKMVSVFSVPGGSDRVRVVVAGGEPLDQLVNERPGALEWRFGVKGKTEELVVESGTAGFSTEALLVAEQGAPQQRKAGYVGKRVSFEFKDIDLHNFFRIIAEVSKKNIVVPDDVRGQVTVRLRNVPWDQALDLVLRSKALGKEEFGNIVRIAPLATLQAEADARAKRREDLENAQPLSVSLLPVNYALAGDMQARVKDLLSKRGTVTVDGRTNTLIIRDLAENVGKARAMVASLDLQTPQVLIESRIVEASTSFRREVGIQWGGQGIMSSTLGNPTGLVFPSSVGVAGAAVPGANNYAVSLPVGAGDGSGGALGLVFGSATGAVSLNLRLSAMEAQGAVKTISAPKVTTLDNAAATISQGVSIPFSQVSAAGANTQFIEASLSLNVTPHITQDGSVLMSIKAQNNQPDPSNTGSNGQPGISRKEASTNVLVKDGETTVIGGIYVRSGSSDEAGLPILSKIPVLGFFFRNHRERENKNELLIFITPRILNRAAVAQNP